MIRVFSQVVFVTSAAALAIVPVGSAHAQDPSQGRPPPDFEIMGVYSRGSDGDLDSGGSFSEDRWLGKVGVTTPVSRNAKAGVSLEFGRAEFDFTDSALSDDVEVTEATLAFPILARFDGGRIGGLFIPRVGFASETGVGMDDAVTYGFLAALRWRINENLSVGPGVGLSTELGDDSDLTVFPFLVIDWDITEKWNLGTGPGIAVSRGPGLTLTYTATESFEFGLTVRNEDFSFRLNDDHSTPDGIARDTHQAVYLTGTWSATDEVNLTGFVGARVNGNFEVSDEDGNRVADSDYDTSTVVGLLASARF